MPVDDPLTLEALAACTEVPQRTIRYYIQRGLVPRPHGEKKGAYYDITLQWQPRSQNFEIVGIRNLSAGE